MSQEKATLYELWTGILLWCFVIGLIGGWFAKHPLICLAGLASGAVLAMVDSALMLRSIRRNVERGGAKFSMGASAVLRVLLVLAVLAGTYFFPYTDMISAFAGMFTLKLSAYIQPVTHKIFLKAGITKDIEYPPTEVDESGAREKMDLIKDITNVV